MTMKRKGMFAAVALGLALGLAPRGWSGGLEAEAVNAGKQFDLTGEMNSAAPAMQALEEAGGSGDGAKAAGPENIAAESYYNTGRSEVRPLAAEVPSVKANGADADEDPFKAIKSLCKKALVAAGIGFAAAIYGFQTGAGGLMVVGLAVAGISVWVGMIAMQVVSDAYHYASPSMRARMQRHGAGGPGFSD